MSELTFQAMGSPVHVIVTGDPRLLHGARRMVEDLEAKWSRFLPSSELSRLNEAGSAVVSWETIVLVERAIEGWRASEGRFDPTVLDALVTHGYDRSFESVPARVGFGGTRPAPGCEGIVVAHDARVVALPEGVHLDPGGIGKGLAADLVVCQLMADGAAGAMVSIGGDLRAEGDPPRGSAWSVAIDEPAAGGYFGTVSMTAGAVATSTTRTIRWTVDGETVHHLIDPRQGRSVAGGVVLATVVAAEGWWAEVATKDLIGKDPGTEGLEETAGLVVTADGGVRLVGGMEAYLS